MYRRIIPSLALLVASCLLIWVLATSFGGYRFGYGGFYPPIFLGPFFHNSQQLPHAPAGSSGRSPQGNFRGGGTTGHFGGK